MIYLNSVFMVDANQTFISSLYEVQIWVKLKYK